MIAFLAPLVAGAADQPIRIRVGTAAPEGSPWHQILQKTREDWARISANQYVMSIYPSGVQGDEIDMIRKVRVGGLHAVALSGVGLAHIEPAVGCLQIPMLIDSWEEFDYVRDRIGPRLEAMIEKKGFIVLQWSDVGWVHFFSKTPVRTPADIRRLKLFTSAGDPEGEKLYKEFGLQVVPLAVTDMLPSLRTNLIQAFDVPPLFALLDQSFGVAKNMLDLKWAPLAGATLLSVETWQKTTPAQRAEMLKSARAAGESVRAKIRKLGDDAVGEMQKRGLTVTSLDAATKAQWRAEAEASYPKIRGRSVPADMFDEVVRQHKEFGATRPTTTGKAAETQKVVAPKKADRGKR
jgi:TRAP-type C4-dicarboxylate transport system substrate-binding protein